MEALMDSSTLHTPPDTIENPNCKRPRMMLNPLARHDQNNLCNHPDIILKVCTSCWKRMELDDEKAMQDKAVFEKLLEEKKLSLVLDLDHTLLHSIRLKSLTQKGQDLIFNLTDPSSSSFTSSLIRTVIFGEDWVVKLRPGLNYFLEEASKMFSLHVFTRSRCEYAMEMVRLIDPGKVYFDCRSRILTRESCFSSKLKSLDLVIGRERGILILDDKTRVWSEMDRKNLVVIPRYDFFGYPNSQLAMGTDESEREGYLNLYLDFFKLIHRRFFDPKGEGNLFDKDVRNLLECLKNESRKRKRLEAVDKDI